MRTKSVQSITEREIHIIRLFFMSSREFKNRIPTSLKKIGGAQRVSALPF